MLITKLVDAVDKSTKDLMIVNILPIYLDKQFANEVSLVMVNDNLNSVIV